VHLSSMEDDFYVFDAARNHLVGRRTRRIIKLGEKVSVQVAKVDTFKKQVDFRLGSAASRPARQDSQLFRRVKVKRRVGQ
jgi:ribonuclease R